MKHWLILALLASLITPVYACRCREMPPVAEAALKADAIFVGRLMKLSVAEREFDGEGRKYEVIECEFQLDIALKGIVASSKRVVIFTGTAVPSCGYPFRIGEEFLVYARAEGGGLETNVCMRTRPRFIIDDDQDFSGSTPVKGDDAMETEVPQIRLALKVK